MINYSYIHIVYFLNLYDTYLIISYFYVNFAFTDSS